MHYKFNVEGMTCSSCQAHVQKSVEKLDGCNNVNVNLLKNTLDVDIDLNKCSIELVKKAVSNAGYKAYINEEEKKKSSKDLDLINLIVSFTFLLVLMYFSMGHMMWGWIVPNVFNMHTNPMGFSLIQFILVLPIIFIYRNYIINGYMRLFKLNPNMDSLIALGSSISLIYGIYALFMISLGKEEYHMYLYFEAAGMILTFVSLGKYLEKLSKRKTTTSITKLIELAPKSANLLINGIENNILVEEVNIGDTIVIRKGEQVPLDGIIIEGNCYLDTSSLTGESLPVYKSINEEVLSSSIITNGYIKVKVTKRSVDSSINQIIKLVEEASSSKAPISKLVDKISFYFVPLIILISLLTFIINICINKNFELSLNFSLTVLVIACPCALGLATPVAIMVSSGKGASLGLLIKNAEILEKTKGVKVVCLDKTGTITKGKPVVVDLINLNNQDNLSLIYSLEENSEHPLSNSIKEYAIRNNTKLVKVDSYTSIDGEGIGGTINEVNYYIGNLKMVKKHLEVNKDIISKYEELSSLGEIILFFFNEKEVLSLIGIVDEIKDTSIEAIKELKKLGIKVIMLTGDNEKVASSVGNLVGVDEVISNVLPNEKYQVINSLKEKSLGLVAMVGDGVNDSIALTSADLGISMSSGSDIAQVSSDIILLRNDLIDVVNAIRLSKRTLFTIKLSLFWAFIYNFICVLLSTGFIYYLTNNSFKMTPMIGSIAMSISSVSVVLNALTINLFKPIKCSNKIEEEKEKKDMKEVIINVEGMMCMHCVKHVQDALNKIDGVESNVPSLEEKNVKIILNKEVDIEILKKAIIDAGYDVK